MKNKCKLIQMRDNDNGLDLYLNQYSDADLIAWQARIDNYDKPCRSKVVLTKDQVNAQHRARKRWQAHRTGNAYMLQVQNRTCSHSFRVQSHGKNVWQAVLRYYKGLDGNLATWQATKVISATKI